MRTSDSFPRELFFGVLAVFILALFGALVINAAKSSRANLPVLGDVPDFDLTEKNGARFSSDEMAGSLWLVDFIFTSCPGACPVMSRNMAELYQLYSHSAKIRFLSISVDPDNDSLPVLQEYARQHGVTDARWMFLRGPIDNVVQICEGGFKLPAENLPMGHSTKFVLVDQNRQFRGYYDGMSEPEIELLKTHVHELARHLP